MTEDYKDQLSNNRARTKDSKGNEQQVLVQVSARSTADLRSISRRSCHKKHHQPDDSMSLPTKHSELRRKMEGPREIRSEESGITSADSDKMRQLPSAVRFHIQLVPATAARTVATRNRRCENQSRCPSSLLRARKHCAMSFGSLWMHSSRVKDEGQSAR